MSTLKMCGFTIKNLNRIMAGNYTEKVFENKFDVTIDITTRA